jgi:hypothetical protein
LTEDVEVGAGHGFVGEVVAFLRVERRKGKGKEVSDENEEG